MPRQSKAGTNINQYSGYKRPSRIEMTHQKYISVGSQTNDAINKIATDATDVESEQIISNLWNDTFISYEPEMVVKLPYFFQQHNVQTTGAGLATVNQFKMNSLYDFDLTNAGHQPLGRDTWTAIYDYYKVLETRVHVIYRATQYNTGAVGAIAGNNIDANGGPAYMAPLYIGLLQDITANPPTTLTNWHEAKRVTKNHQQRFSNIKVLERMGDRPGTTQHFDDRWTPDMFDTAILNDATQNTWTPVGSDPTNLNYLSALAYNTNSSSNSANFSLEVHATMLVAFKNVNRSLLLTTN